jgi:NTP pyrophosphatase (non-canonical NTP hydrolase)
MMTLRQFYLTKLIEECQEVSQRAAKSMQFGSTEVQKGQEKTNATRLRDEVEDLLALIALVENNTDDLPEESTVGHIHRTVDKTQKVLKYLKYSQELGMVGDE